MIDAHNFPIEQIARAYDFRSGLYDAVIAASEFTYHLKALDTIQWEPGMRALEVATGPGRVMVEIAKRVGPDTRIYGLDLSNRMLGRVRKRLVDSGHAEYELRRGDCRSLPWPDKSFDLLYNGYMMDLIPKEDMHGVLREFHRVLKPGGQLVLLNMSKKGNGASGMEYIYRSIPKYLALYLIGNCRPVQMRGSVVEAGFINVKREFLNGRHPSEIVAACK